eukprot:scpid54577/ scgid7166/ Beta-1,3-galactosyltransferase 1; UDP-Gal:betaGlcNAc beta 1,3-galactosyltransferase-I; UDP-galactose:beta-N-acetyl-glucosamine-beta-1,3-galactosyltransferase 1 &gt; Beta-1,3-galactosyltransferase 1; UDP-galactose:beta-N-acetyl-glucosamine-beta-1,3-galactosyltransferase 1 &gt; Beta-1,3-galactosyltransferase 1; UDP-galactose:beta-N-acetyl-glucosamine-beta-1,3-galactosyltransferase 1 &gt; Beta-1,3-galactosyltransferase 1; UDP-galactose:beta-N-acetyl-glucosamine-beta-1,3-galac
MARSIRRLCGVKFFRSALIAVWSFITIFLFVFFWSEWDHSTARQRLASCVHALNSELNAKALQTDSISQGNAARIKPWSSTNGYAQSVADPLRKSSLTTGADVTLLAPVPTPDSILDTRGRQAADGLTVTGKVVEAGMSAARTLQTMLGAVPLIMNDGVDMSIKAEATPAIEHGLATLSPPGASEANGNIAPRLSSAGVAAPGQPHEPNNGRGILTAAARVAGSVPGLAQKATAKKDTFLLTLILSAPKYRERRDAARLVWVQPKSTKKLQAALLPIAYKFICGQASEESTNELLRNERDIRQDILILDVVDSYKALAKKVLWGFQWARDNVHFQYLMKTDDDVFFNIHELFFSIFLPLNSEGHVAGYYGGHTVGRYKGKGVVVKRNPQSKWYVSRSAYGPDRFPPYNQGHGYILSMDLVNLTLAKAAGRQVIPVEDAYIGILLYESQIKPVHNVHIYDRLTRSACNDDQAILIGWVQPGALKTMVSNKNEGRPLCDSVDSSEVLDA